MTEPIIDKNYWDDSWHKFSFERYYGVEKYLALSNKLNGLFKQYLPKGNSRILEIGCARGKQLIYFAKEFGHSVYGVDLSEEGVKTAKDNLKRAKVLGDIRCEDIFKTTLKEESFDIVYSMGLVEHFNELGDVVDAHTRLLKRGGKLIITVPNFRGSLYLSMSRLFGTRSWILEKHNLDTMDKDIWLKMLKDKDLKLLFLDYFGVVDLTLSFGMIRFKPILYPMLLINQMIGYATYFLGNSSYLSPYLVIIAKKREY